MEPIAKSNSNPVPKTSIGTVQTLQADGSIPIDFVQLLNQHGANSPACPVENRNLTGMIEQAGQRIEQAGQREELEQTPSDHSDHTETADNKACSSEVLSNQTIMLPPLPFLASSIVLLPGRTGLIQSDNPVVHVFDSSHGTVQNGKVKDLAMPDLPEIDTPSPVILHTKPMQTNFQAVMNQTAVKHGLVRDQILPRLDQWVESVTASKPAGMTSQLITIRLAPDEMGELHIRLRHSARGLVAQFSTDSQDALSQLVADREQLRDSLKSMGSIAKLDFSLRPAAIEAGSQNQPQSNSAQSQPSPFSGNLDVGGRSYSGREGQSFSHQADPHLTQSLAESVDRIDPEDPLSLLISDHSRIQHGGWHRIIDYRT